MNCLGFSRQEPLVGVLTLDSNDESTTSRPLLPPLCFGRCDPLSRLDMSGLLVLMLVATVLIGYCLQARLGKPCAPNCMSSIRSMRSWQVIIYYMCDPRANMDVGHSILCNVSRMPQTPDRFYFQRSQKILDCR